MAERRNGPSGVKNAKSAAPKAGSGDGRRKAASGNGAAKAKTKAKAPRKPRARRARARKGAEGADKRHPTQRRPVGTLEHPRVEHAPVAESSLSEREAQLLGDLFAVVEEHAGERSRSVRPAAGTSTVGRVRSTATRPSSARTRRPRPAAAADRDRSASPRSNASSSPPAAPPRSRRAR